MRFWREAVSASAISVGLLSASYLQADAQEIAAEPFYEIETKYIFGFTEGSSIGLEGEKEISSETVGGFGKRDGRYAASQTKLEFEHTPTQFIQFEFGALVATHNIKNVTDLNDRNAANF